MNTNSNTYTVIYSTVLVVLVAAILAFTALVLKDKQDENVKVETISKILTAAGLYNAEEAAAQGNAYAIKTYEENIISAIIINQKGEQIGQMNTQGNNIEFKVNLATQANLMKQGLLQEVELPVYIFKSSGRILHVVPCYGAGLWGPIWGYIALEEDMNTIAGAIFDHKGETPGLGAEIASPKFYGQFVGKQIYEGNDMVSIAIMKGGAPEGSLHGVDAISGGTITSQALDKTIKTWLDCYQPYFESVKQQVEEK